jgi:DNA polymerase (family 10)
MENIEIAKRLDEIGDLLDIQGANPFRIRAYHAAARTIGTLPTPVQSLLKTEPDALEELPGIGADLAGKIGELCRTGSLPLLRQLTRKTPESLVALLRIPGLGPRRAKLIHKSLGVRTLPQLERAARAGRLSKLRGLGAATEQAILQGIAQEKAHGNRVLLADAEAYARPLVEMLHATPGVLDVEIAGSFRRRCETVGDVDLLIAASKPASVVQRFVHDASVARVLAEGPTRCSVVLESGLQVDLRIVPRVSFGSALHYFTGSKPHNIAVRAMGVKRHLKINEYGVFRGTRRIAGRTEREVYAAVGLPWIPPELRENRGELQAAHAGTLPHLVELTDVKGDLQVHTTATDGHNTLAEMIEACAGRGYEYVAVTDHTHAVRVAGGLTRAGFRKQFREIDALQKKWPRLKILKGAEVDILESGALDLDDATLAELDLVLVSVHSHFNLAKAAMTRRVIRALQHPRVHIFGHPTSRLIGKREPLPLDMPVIVQAARDYGVMLEINAQPDRLDLNDRYAAMAREAGVPLVISTDAHRIAELDYLRFGVDQARRAWCTARDIANTRAAPAFSTLLHKPA